MSMYRQGDILIVAITSEPEGERVARDAQGRIVLALGEATGHAHAIADPGAELLEADGDERFLRVLIEGGVDLTHEEHAAIHLPQGDYRVIRQREFTYPEGSPREGWSWVVD